MIVANAFGKKMSVSALVVLVMFLLTASSFAQEKTDAKQR